MRTLNINGKYLKLPVNREAPVKRLRLYTEDVLRFDFECKLSERPERFMYVNVGRFYGSEAVMTVEADDNVDIYGLLSLTDTIPEPEPDALRPAVHFTASRGWINDPNGLIFADGVYHMFFQHNPAGTDWGNMHWGHAVSSDLTRWRELDDALFPDEMGTMFSGSAIRDDEGIAGFGKGAILLYYTAAGGTSKLSEGKPFTQCLAYSNDGGVTFEKYAGNPVIPHIIGGNRDLKIIKCDETGGYILALYLDGSEYGLLHTDDFLHFRERQRLALENDSECPDFYPLYTENGGERKWILSGAADKYIVGHIDAESGMFVPEQETLTYHHGARTSYAAQTFSGTGERRIKIAWDVMTTPDSDFNNQMSAPCEVSLVKLGGLYRLKTLPAPEFDRMRRDEGFIAADASVTGTFKCTLSGGASDINLRLPRESPDFTLSAYGIVFNISPSSNVISFSGTSAPLYYSEGGDVDIRIITDTLGAELFIDGGLIYTTTAAVVDKSKSELIIDVKEPLKLSLNVWELKKL